jgi:hypothetical protein
MKTSEFLSTFAPVILIPHLTKLLMKKLLFLFVSIFALTLFASAQDFYIKPIFGVSAKALPNNYKTVEEKTIIGVDTTRYDDKYKSNLFSFGEGKHMGLSFGKYFNSGAEALELNASYFHGTTQKMTSKSLIEFDPYSAYSYSETWTELHTLKSLNLSLLYSRNSISAKFLLLQKLDLLAPTLCQRLIMSFLFSTPCRAMLLVETHISTHINTTTLSQVEVMPQLELNCFRRVFYHSP